MLPNLHTFLRQSINYSIHTTKCTPGHSLLKLFYLMCMCPVLSQGKSILVVHFTV